jgi:phenylacetate-CoA ligase
VINQEVRKSALLDTFDTLETRSPAEREASLFARLPEVLKLAAKAPASAKRFDGIDLDSIRSREALASLPVLRKSDLPALQKTALPFGGFVADEPGSFGRLFTSPGPIFEPEAAISDPWRSARGLSAALSFRRGPATRSSNSS